MQYHELSPSSSSPSSSSFSPGKSYQLMLVVICDAATSQSVTSILSGCPTLFTMHLHFTPPASLPGAWDMVPLGWSTCTGPADRTWDLWETRGHPLKHHGQHWVSEFGQWLPHCHETAVQFPAASYPDAIFYPEMAAAWFWTDCIPHRDKHLPNPSLSFISKPSTNGPNPTNTDCIGKEWWVLSGSLALAQHLHHWVGTSVWKPVSSFHSNNS